MKDEEYLRFRPLIRGLSISSRLMWLCFLATRSFRPLIRGLSISSRRYQGGAEWRRVSVPSSGDYQFLLD